MWLAYIGIMHKKGMVIIIELASKERLPEVIALWKEAFGDSEEYVKKFFDKMNGEKNMILRIEEGKTVSMASMLPVKCGNYRGRYIYAVATAEKCRGRGYCRQIMAFIHDYMAEGGENFAILVPAEKSLFDFYKKMGYSQTVFAPDTANVGEITNKCTISEYYNIRKNLFSEYDLIEWGERELSYILSLGEIWKTEDGAAYFEDGKAVEILNRSIFSNIWTEPFALMKYIGDTKIDKPYFGLAMN